MPTSPYLGLSSSDKPLESGARRPCFARNARGHRANPSHRGRARVSSRAREPMHKSASTRSFPYPGKTTSSCGRIPPCTSSRRRRAPRAPQALDHGDPRENRAPRCFARRRWRPCSGMLRSILEKAPVTCRGHRSCSRMQPSCGETSPRVAREIAQGHPTLLRASWHERVLHHTALCAEDALNDRERSARLP